MIGTYRDFVAVLEIEIDRLRCAEDYLNVEGKLLLRAYRKIRELTSFAESCEELLEVGVEAELDEDEKKAARLALKAIHRVAEAEAEKDSGADAKGEPADLIEAICDRVCQFRDLEQEELDEKCQECPVSKLADMIGV